MSYDNDLFFQNVQNLMEFPEVKQEILKTYSVLKIIPFEF